MHDYSRLFLMGSSDEISERCVQCYSRLFLKPILFVDQQYTIYKGSFESNVQIKKKTKTTTKNKTKKKQQQQKKNFQFLLAWPCGLGTNAKFNVFSGTLDSIRSFSVISNV